jgi:hypothetical protein
MWSLEFSPGVAPIQRHALEYSAALIHGDAYAGITEAETVVCLAMILCASSGKFLLRESSGGIVVVVVVVVSVDKLVTVTVLHGLSISHIDSLHGIN